MTPVLELNEITLEYPKSQSLLTIIKRKVLHLLGKNATAPHYKGLEDSKPHYKPWGSDWRNWQEWI